MSPHRRSPSTCRLRRRRRRAAATTVATLGSDPCPRWAAPSGRRGPMPPVVEIDSGTDVYDVLADPSRSRPAQRHDVALKVAPVLGLGPGKVDELLAKPGQFVYLAKQVSDTVRQKLQALQITGIGTLESDARVYPQSAV